MAPAAALKHLALFEGMQDGLDAAVDVRVMHKKPAAEVEGGAVEPTTTIAHPSGRWQRANLVHVFAEQLPVLTFAVPLLSSAAGSADRIKQALQPVALAEMPADASYDEEEEAVSPGKRKRDDE